MLAPEEAMRELMHRDIEQNAFAYGGWVLEGFPRTRAQLISLMNWTRMPTFFLIDVPELICVERLRSRARTDDNPDSIAQKFQFYRQETEPMCEMLAEVGSLHRINGKQSKDVVFTTIKELL